MIEFLYGKVPTAGWHPPDYENRFIGIHSQEVTLMTAYEILSTFMGILALLMSFGSLLVALLTFLDKRNSKK